jgi:cytochrome-b5 reductase
MLIYSTDVKTKEYPDGEPVSRKYTPTSGINMMGKFELLIKVYFKDTHPHFPEGGKMSQYLNDIPIGSNINVRGPFGKLSYFGDGNVKILKKFKPLTYLEKKFSKICMIGGGTGITPFYQIVQAANDHKDVCEFWLLFANKSTKDILLKSELEEIFKAKNIKFNLFFTIDRHEDGWDGGVGFISKEMIQSFLPPPGDDTLLLTCGPPIMCVDHLPPIFKGLGYLPENIFDF